MYFVRQSMSRSKSQTLPFETRSNVATIALSPDGGLLICVDGEGYALVVSLVSNSVLCHYNFRGPIQSLVFSPDGLYRGARYG
jgi:periodic tryptophan protein 2